MNKLLLHTPWALGLAVVAWVGAGYLPGNPLALALVLAIAAFFGVGVMELLRFERETAGLASLIDQTREPPAALADWLQPLPTGLRDMVRLRIEGERVALPGPALAPYLSGLLVLLGMLGTFLGMVVTLRGTGLALENAGDVSSIRATLAAPVKGLGLAFGCSVAGVAASAALGLMSALARRERLRVARALDAAIAGPLRAFSLRHQREEAMRLLQAQTAAVSNAVSTALPALASQIETLVLQLQRQGQALNDGLLAGQQQFHAEARASYQGLAQSVDRTLKQALTDGARQAGEALQPAVQSTLAGLAQQSTALQATLQAAVQQQIDGIAAKLDAGSAAMGERWQSALDAQQRQGEAQSRALQAGLERFATTFEQRSAALVDDVGAGFERQAQDLLRSVAASHAALDAASAAREGERLAAFHAGLSKLADEMQGQARAAAEVIGELRGALSESLVRDNAALDERQRLLSTLSNLLDAVNQSSREQRGAIDVLVSGSGQLMERLGTRFEQTVEQGARTMNEAAVQLGGSAAEVASLGDGFGTAVQRFGEAGERLASQLQRIEAALGQSMARSDEQLAYYVAQAREIVDLTIGSQKQVIDELHQLRRTAEAA